MMVLTPEEIKVVKSFLAPAIQNGLLDGKKVNALLKLASESTDQPDAAEKLYTIREAAEILRVHPKSVWRFIREGRLECIHLGKKSARIPASSLMMFVNK